jgi:hypothetical protein
MAITALVMATRCSLLAPSDAELRGSARSDSGIQDGAADISPYSPLSDTLSWSTFDTTSRFAAAHDFAGAAFDGRHVIFAPRSSGLAASFDTQGAGGFSDKSSWSVFDLTTKSDQVKGYRGAAFDGRYVYLVPFQNVFNSVLAQYDSREDFSSTSAWATFDTTAVAKGAAGFVGAVFDGRRYLYFVPNNNQFSNSDGIVARYDTQAPLADPTSWKTFDTVSLSSFSVGFQGGVFDGRYLYLVPNFKASNPTVTRFDTQTAFEDPASWKTFDVSAVAPAPMSFLGAAFDGRYVFLSPSDSVSPVLQYDTKGSFGSSWSAFTTSSVRAGAAGFAGTAFDGRFVYFAPDGGTTPHGLVVRYDTRGPFSLGASWAVFDATSVNPACKGFMGAVFDGSYVYFVPGTGGIVTRFFARPMGPLPNLPSLYSTSF